MIRIALAALCLLISGQTFAYKIGEDVSEFRLKNVDGGYVALADFVAARGVAVVFTCNHCPFAKAYEERIIALDRYCTEHGWKMIAINPNDPAQVPEDSFENMQRRAEEKQYRFPYLFDDAQEVAKAFGASRTPHVFLLKNGGSSFTVEYIGAIDDNVDHPEQVRDKYVEGAINAIAAGARPDTPMTRAVGCTIKWKK
jgi:peroxiredoxin